MKKILFILSLFISFVSFGQTYQAMPQAGYGPINRMLFNRNGVLSIPMGITDLNNISGGRDTSQIRYNKLDSSVYVYTGHQWLKVSSSASSKVDSVTISGINICYWKSGSSTCTAIDTSIISTKYYVNNYVTNYVDSSIAINNYYTGNSTCLPTLLEGSIIWVNGFNFSNTKLKYLIGCQLDSVDASNFSISAADTTDRYTIIYADTLGQLHSQDGSTGAVASIPTIDPRSQILLATYFIPANSTQPQLLSNTVIYKENVEWTGSGTLTGLDFSYPTLPYQGLVSTYVPTITQGGYFSFADGTNHLLSNSQYLSFYVKNLAVYNGYYYVVFGNANGWVGYAPVHTGTYGYNGSLVGSYHLVSIATNEIVMLQNSNDYTYILFDFDLAGTVSTGGMQFDNIILQSGGGNQSSTGVKSVNGQTGNVVITHQFNSDSSYNYTLVNGVITDSVSTLKRTLVAQTGITITSIGVDSFGIASTGGTGSSQFRDTTGNNIYLPSVYPKMGVGNINPLAPIHVGDTTNYINSNDPAILVARKVTNASGSGSSHQFVSMPWYTRDLTGTGAVDFDARPYYSGAMSADHFVGMQNLPIWNSSGTATKAYGIFSALTINSGSIGTHYGVYIGDPVGSGTLNYNYGVYLPDFSKGLLGNYGIYQRGSNVNYFGGNVGFGDSTPTAKVHIFGATNRQIQLGINTAGFDNNTFFPNYVSGDNNINMSRSTDGSFTESFFNYQATSGLSEIGIASRGGVTLHAGTDPANKLYLNSIGGVGIGTMSQHASAILDLVTTTRGFKPPVMTNAQINLITSPIAGLIASNSDSLNRPFVYTGSAWKGLAFTDEASSGITGYDSQTATASQTAFTFPSVPSSYNDFWIDINGATIPQSFYTKSGSVVTFSTGLQLGAIVTYHRIK